MGLGEPAFLEDLRDAVGTDEESGCEEADQAAEDDRGESAGDSTRDRHENQEQVVVEAGSTAAVRRRFDGSFLVAAVFGWLAGALRAGGARIVRDDSSTAPACRDPRRSC